MTVLAENKESGQELLELKTSQIIDPPANPAKVARSDRAPSIITAAVTIIGQLQSQTRIQIDGRVEGDVVGDFVKVGSTGVINGLVGGNSVEVAGTIKGKIEAESVVLVGGARVDGEIIYQTLQFGPDARFEGNCRPHFGKTQAKSSDSGPPPAHRIR